jgi:preprotein translocase subunit SecD
MTRSLQWRIATVATVLAVCLFLLYPSLGPVPAFWADHLPNNPIRLGLDLQGGLYLVLEVETNKAIAALTDQAISEASAAMKDARVRYTDIVRTSDTGFSVYLKDQEQSSLFDGKVLDKLVNLKKISSGSSAKGFEIKLQFDPKAIPGIKERAVRQAVDTIRNRVDAFGVAEPDVVMQGEDRIVVQLPGLKEDINRAIDIIKKTARLEFKLVDDSANVSEAEQGNIPEGDEVLYEVNRSPRTGAVARVAYVIKKRILMTGDVITDARVEPGRNGGWVVGIDFNSVGARQFGRITSENIHKRLAIILDNRVFSAPVIKSAIPDGRAEISGQFTPDDAHDLALVLRAGSLPAPVKILENRSVGPSLGSDSIRSGRDAILIGIILIAICMVVYYKWSGVVADIALTLNPLLLFAVMCSPGLRATLTLPGLAGVALTIGVAIDANILIFERVREELRLGKSARAAMEAGYDKAFVTILDTHLTNIIAALPLIQFGTGPVKGFAVTLCIGLVISLFTAFFVTRTIFDYVFVVKRFKRISI